MRTIVITGSPGTGKRTVAAFLAAEKGFLHVDLEHGGADLADLMRLLGQRGYCDLEPEGVVVASAERFPDELFDLIGRHEIDWVWFDGDRGAMRPPDLDGPRGRPAPRFVDPFEADGSFRPVEAVVADVLSRS